MRIAIFRSTPTRLEECVLSLAVKRAGMEPMLFWTKVAVLGLEKWDGYIFADESLENDSANIQLLIEQSALGKPILGFDKGAQFLVNAGLVPGLENNAVGLALINESGSETKKVHVCLGDSYQYNAFTRHLKPSVSLSMQATLPISHFSIKPALRQEMQENGLVLFYYCDAQARISDDSLSLKSIAGISNKMGNVMAMVPLFVIETSADPIFESMHDYIKKGYKQKVNPLYYQVRQ